jgi:hypothetical protein
VLQIVAGCGDSRRAMNQRQGSARHVRNDPIGVTSAFRRLSSLDTTRASWGPSVLRRVRIQEETKFGEYLVADSIEAVVSLAQIGIVEIHTWNSTADDIEHPNRLVWDLDPRPKVS